jgi:CubicO group peptidase (beta-lactamase class C family)
VYELPAGEDRLLIAEARWSGERLMVLVLDAANATRERRSAQFALLDHSVQPASYTRETFAGRTARVLDRERLERLDAFLERGRVELAIPGAAVAIAQGGALIHARGFGVRELAKPAAVDARTLFRIASNTKPLTSLLLARLVDAGELRWEQPVREVYPQFQLADAAITAATHVEHLLCACTGLPRSERERLFEFGALTPERMMRGLRTIVPTTGFGQAFQYNNQLAAAAGYVGAYAWRPTQPLARAYDQAMRRWVFAPLDMRATTFERASALRGNHATGHTWSMAARGQTEVIPNLGLDRATDPIMPAGGAWSNVHELIAYVQLELAGGVTANGQRLLSEANLLKRRDAYVATAKDAHYGIGLDVDRSRGTDLVGHDGYTFGYHSRMRWLPEHGVGAVFLSNADAGDMLGEAFERYLLELLFDAEPKAQAQLNERATFMRRQLADLLAQLAIPADAGASAGLAAHYHSEQLGALDVERRAGATIFDFGEWQSEVASHVHADHGVSFLTITPGYDIFELVAGVRDDGKRELVLSDAQHRYAFVESAKPSR